MAVWVSKQQAHSKPESKYSLDKKGPPRAIKVIKVQPSFFKESHVDLPSVKAQQAPKQQSEAEEGAAAGTDSLNNGRHKVMSLKGSPPPSLTIHVCKVSHLGNLGRSRQDSG